MAARDTGETAVSPSGTSADPPPARPSWETPAPSLRPAARATHELHAFRSIGGYGASLQA